MDGKEEITINDVFNLIKGVITNNEQSKEEIKKEIRSAKAELSEELESIKRENKELRKENNILKNRVQDCERKLRKYNLVIYGLKEEHKKIDEIQNLLQLINEKLQIDCHFADIRDIHRIGQPVEDKARPVCVELISYQLKTEILGNAKKLKGSNIYIAQDYIPEDYKKRKVLHEHLQRARANNYNAYIKNNQLIVNGELFTYEVLQSQGLVVTNEIEEDTAAQTTDNQDISQKNYTEQKKALHYNTESNDSSSNNTPGEKKRKATEEETDNPTKRSTRQKNTNIKYFN